MAGNIRKLRLPPLGSRDHVISRREVPMVSITDPGLSPRPWSQKDSADSPEAGPTAQWSPVTLVKHSHAHSVNPA